MSTNIYMGNWRYTLQSLDPSNKHVIQSFLEIAQSNGPPLLNLPPT